jgi:hypothetical protein
MELFLHTMISVSPRQFAIFRILLGIYLAVHFAQLIPYGAEMFSDHGVLADARLNFTYGILPNILEHYDSPTFVVAFLLAMSILAVAFAFGFQRHFAALLLWYGWACLFNRNNLINNPSIPYIGLLLLLTLLVPNGETLTSARDHQWKFPGMVYWTAWILTAAGYSFSGWMKLHSPSWVDGTALYHVLNNPLARPGITRDLLLALPEPCLKILTWASLGAELLFLPLSVHRHGRMIAWSALGAMNLVIVFAINFADLTVGMLLLHLFTFDPGWCAALQRHWPRLEKFGPILRTEVLHSFEILAFHPTSLDGATVVRLRLPRANRDESNSAD